MKPSYTGYTENELCATTGFVIPGSATQAITAINPVTTKVRVVINIFTNP